MFWLRNKKEIYFNYTLLSGGLLGVWILLFIGIISMGWSIKGKQKYFTLKIKSRYLEIFMTRFFTLNLSVHVVRINEIFSVTSHIKCIAA